MNRGPAATAPFQLGDWSVHPDTGLLRSATRTVRLDPRVMAVLLTLTERAGAVVSKQSLLEEVWAGANVAEDAVTVAIYELRKALEDDARNPEYIETIPRRGYRLVHARSSPPPPPRRFSKGLAAGVAVVAAAIALLVGWSTRTAPAKALIAVIPFELHSSSDDDRYLASGLAESMTSDLARVDGLSVIAHHSVRGIESPRDRALETLNVTHIVSGSLVRHEHELRINVHLSKPGHESYVWSDTYRGAIEDFFSLQRQVAVSVATELDHELSERRVGRSLSRRVDPISEEAMRSYLLGRYFWNQRDPTSLAKAVSFFERALQVEPELALAWSGLADAHTFPGPHALGLDRDEGYRRALEASERAMELDPELADAYVSAGAIHFVYERDFSKAERMFRQGLAHAPSHALAHQWYGELLSAKGEHERAIAHMGEAARLDPRSTSIRFDLFWVEYMAGRFADAVESLDATIHLDADDGPVDPLLYWSKARAEVRLGRMEDALASLERFYEAAASTVPEEAQRLRRDPTSAAFDEFRLAALQKEAENGRAFPLSLAGAYASAGEVEPALMWLERAVDEGDAASLWIAVDPDLESLRNEPRFVELVRQLGLQHVLAKARRAPTG